MHARNINRIQRLEGEPIFYILFLFSIIYLYVRRLLNDSKL